MGIIISLIQGIGKVRQLNACGVLEHCLGGWKDYISVKWLKTGSSVAWLSTEDSRKVKFILMGEDKTFQEVVMVRM